MPPTTTRGSVRSGLGRSSIAQLDAEDCFLTLQTLSEYFASVTRKANLSVADASVAVADYRDLFPVVAATPDSLRMAIGAVKRHGLSFWDAMQWAVARQAGATLFLSEDLQDGRELEGVRFRDPFRADDPFAPSR